MAKIEKKTILHGNLSIFFLASFKDLGMKFFWKNLIFNREENNNRDCRGYRLGDADLFAFLFNVNSSFQQKYHIPSAQLE